MIDIFVAYLFFLIELFIIECLSLSRKCKNYLELRLSFFQFFLFAAFRDVSVINDTKPYVSHFLKLNANSNILHINPLDRFEIGYQILENILHQFVDSAFGFIFLTSLIVLFVAFIFIRRLSYLPGLSCILYFVMNLYITHIGVLRQTFALSFSYLVFYFLSKKQNLLAFVFVVFALMMHSSASFLFLFWIAFNITISRKKICLVLLFLVILFCFYNSFIPYVLNSDSRYMTSSAVKGFFSLVGIANTIYTLFLFLIIISLRKTVIEDVDYDNVFFWFALFQIVLSVLSIRIWVLERFNMYLTPYLMVYVTNLIANQMSLRKKTIMCLFTVFTFSLFFFLQLYLRPEWFSIIPYKFIKV